MINIKINSENKKDIIKYLDDANKTTFKDTYTLLSEMGEGILIIEEKDNIITVDLIADEIYGDNGFIVDDMEDIFEELTEKYPNIELSGDYEVQLKYSSYINEFEYSPSKEFKQHFLVQCEECGKKDKMDNFIFAEEEYASGICSFKCAFNYVFNVQHEPQEDGFIGYDTLYPLDDFDEYWEDWFWDMLTENLDEVLTEKNAELVLGAMLDDCENEEAIEAVQNWINNNL